jgi:uncharacterized membrane protein
MTSPLPPPRPTASVAATNILPEHISQNIADIVELQQRETAGLGQAQRRLELIGRFIARPRYFVALFVLVGGWIAFNLSAPRWGLQQIDAAPFPWLQGVLTFVALLTSTVVLIAQRRQAKLSEQHAHLDLQINLLTEQKVTKVIHLIEELRGDLPMVQDREDPHASALKEKTDAAQVLSVLKTTDLGSETASKTAAKE